MLQEYSSRDSKATGEGKGEEEEEKKKEKTHTRCCNMAEISQTIQVGSETFMTTKNN